MKNAWFPFYPTDWQADPKLRLCSLSARGLWIEILSIMHESIPRGHLLVAGESVTDSELAILVGSTPDIVTPALAELQKRGVFDRADNGVIVSRKMVRDEQKSVEARENGRKGGNKNLAKSEGGVNPRDKGGVNPTLNPPLNPTLNPPLNPRDKGRDKPQSPESESSKEKANAFSKSKRGSRLQENWEPTDADRKFALDKGYSDNDIQAVAERFRNYWLAKAGDNAVKRDWGATWRNWILKDMEDNRQPNRGQSGGKKPSNHDAFAAGAIRSTD